MLYDFEHTEKLLDNYFLKSITTINRIIFNTKNNYFNSTFLMSIGPD